VKLSTKLATTAGALVLAGSGALAAFATSPAVAHVPVVVRLSATTQASPSQTNPAPPPTSGGTAAETPGVEAPDTAGEATTEPANEPQVPGGGHADASRATADHQFDGVE